MKSKLLVFVVFLVGLVGCAYYRVDLSTKKSGGVKVVVINKRDSENSGCRSCAKITLKFINISDSLRKLEHQSAGFRRGPTPEKMHDLQPNESLILKELNYDDLFVIRNRNGGRIGIIRLKARRIR